MPKVTVAPGVRRAFQEEPAVIMGGVQQQGGVLLGVGPGSEHEVQEKSRPVAGSVAGSVAGPAPGPSMPSSKGDKEVRKKNIKCYS